MGLLFKLFLAYDNRFGMTPKLIKRLRASGNPKDRQAAQSLQSQLDERKRNPPKNIQEFAQRALTSSRQVERDMRVEGRHDEAEQLRHAIDYAEQNYAAKKNKKPNNRGERT